MPCNCHYPVISYMKLNSSPCPLDSSAQPGKTARSSLTEMPLGLGTRQEFISLLISWQLLPSSSAPPLRSGCSPFDWLHASVLREINHEADQRPRVRDDQFYDARCTMALLPPYRQKKGNRITSNRRASLQARVNSVT